MTGQSKTAGAAPFLLTAGAIVLFFLPVLLDLDGVLWSAESDLVARYLPYFDHLAGSDPYPARNPIPFAGVPAAGNPDAPVAYPPVAVYLLWPSAWWIGFVLVAHLVLLAGGMYRLARSMGASRLGASFAGVAVALSARVLGHVHAGQVWLLLAYAWLPWILHLARRLADRPRAAVPLSLAIGMSAATGALQITYLSVVAGAVVAAVATARGERARWPRLSLVAGLFAAATAGGLLVGAATLLPGWLAARESARAAGLEASFAGLFAVGLGDLPGLLLPLHLGHPAEGTFWAGRSYAERCLYPGAAVVVFGLVGASASGDRRRWFLLAGVAAALLFALGNRTPLFPILFRALPGLDRFRVPTQTVLLAMPALALLAARGFDMAFGKTGGDRLPLSRRVLPTVAGILVVGTIAWLLARHYLVGIGADLAGGDADRAAVAVGVLQRSLLFGAAMWIPLILLIRLREGDAISRRGLGVAVIAVVVADAWIAGGRFVETRPASEVKAPNDVAEWIRESRGGFRVLDQAGALPTGTAHWHGVELVGGNDPLLSGRYLAYADLMAGDAPVSADTRIAAERVPVGDGWRRPLLDGLGARYVLSTRELTAFGLRFVTDFPRGPGRTVHLFENPEAAPRTRIVGEWERVDGGRRAAADRIRAGAACVVEGGPAPPERGVGGEVRSLRHGVDRVEVDVAARGPALLLVAESYSRMFAATVDGRAAPVLPANLALVAVPVPAGEHRVVLRAEHAGFETGVFLGLIATVALLAAFFQLERKARKRARRGGSGLSSVIR